MKIYIDQKFWDEFSNLSKSSNQEYYYEIKGFMSDLVRSSHITFIHANFNRVIPKDQILRVINNDVEASYNSLHPDIEYSIQNPKPSHEIFCLSNKSSVELTNLTKKTGLQFYNLNSFDQLLKYSRSKRFTVSKTGNFISWNQIQGIAPPCNFVLMVDGYLLNTFIGEIKANHISLIEILLSKISGETPVTVILLFRAEIRNRQDIQRLESEFKRNLDSTFKNLNLLLYPIDLTNYPKGDWKQQLIHDRFVFTNFSELKSGHSFDYLYPNGRVKDNKHTDLNYASLLDEDVWQYTNDTLTKLKRMIAELNLAPLPI